MPRKSRAAGGSLAQVASAIAAGDFAGGLAGALVAWRATRCAELADLVDAIDARCRNVTIAGRDAKAFQKAWMQLAESKPAPVAIGALATDIATRIPVPHIGTYAQDRDIRRFRAFLDRVAALAKLPADPRIASAIVGVLERAPFTIESGRRIYQPAVDLVVKIADERSAARLRTIVERPTSKAALVRAYFAEALPDAARAIDRAKHTAPSDEDRALATTWIAGLAKEVAPKRNVPRRAASGGRIDGLMAECLAHPDDDAPREVLADALQEREDPRGEFITLQLRAERGALDEAQRKRVNVLLRAHEKEWLGDLAVVTKHRVWRRGFLEQAELARNASAEASTWKRAANDPRLATVRRLDKGAGNSTHYSDFVLSARMRGLREATALSLAMLSTLRSDPRLDTVIADQGLTVDVVKLLESAGEGGPRRLGFTTRLPPTQLVKRIVGWPGRARFADELRALPATQTYEDWMEDAKAWLTAHEKLGAKRLGVAWDWLVMGVERGSHRKLVVEIDAKHDAAILPLLAALPRVERLVLRGGAEMKVVWPELAKALAKHGSALELHDRWADLVTRDRGRARRARRP